MSWVKKYFLLFVLNHTHLISFGNSSFLDSEESLNSPFPAHLHVSTYEGFFINGSVLVFFSESEF